MNEDPKFPPSPDESSAISSREPTAASDSAGGTPSGTTGQTAAEVTAEQIEKPLIDDVSADVAPTVQEFIDEATAANKEEVATVASGTR